MLTLSRRRSLQLGIAVAAVLAAGSLAACGNPSSSDGKVTLRLADSFPPSHTTTVEGAQFFMRRAEELSKGSITFEHYPAEQMAAAPDLLDAAKDGVSDISYVGVAYVGEALPLSDVGSLPGSFETAAEGTKAYWKVVQEHLLQEEYLKQGVRPLWAALNPPYNIATTGRKIEKLDDVHGLLLRASGGTLSRTIQAVGATPVALAAPEIYQALERKTIDGNVGPISSLPDYKLEEIVKYGTTNLSLGSFVQAYVINEGVWQRLAPEQQDALAKAGEETMEHLPSILDREVEETIRSYNEKGLDFSAIPAIEANRFNEIARGIWAQWAKEFDDRGLAGTKTVELWERALVETGG